MEITLAVKYPVMLSVFESLFELFMAVVDLVGSVGYLVLPWLPLVAWLVFWMFAVNWTKLRIQITQQGGWISLLLIAFAESAGAQPGLIHGLGGALILRPDLDFAEGAVRHLEHADRSAVGVAQQEVRILLAAERSGHDRVAELSTHESLDRENSVLGIGDCLTLRDLPDESLAGARINRHD